jgi:hypothetical protein
LSALSHFSWSLLSKASFEGVQGNLGGGGILCVNDISSAVILVPIPCLKLTVDDNKCKIYNTLIKPDVLYGSESWTVTKLNEDKLNIF